MPENCAVCEFHGRMDDPMVAQHWCKKTGENILNPYKGRGKDCPLGDVPTPHGKLIDADKNTFPTPHRNPSNDYMKGWNACLHSVQQQPTVIPAEEET